MRFLPERIGYRFPLLGIGNRLFAQMLRALRTLIIGVDGSGFSHHFGQEFRVFQHRAGAKMVAVERLSLSVGFEKRLLETLNKRFFMYIRS